MKNFFILLFAVVLLHGCEKDAVPNRNPFVPYIPFSLTLNLNLPTYSNLNSNVNPMIINDVNAGVSGLIVMKISDTDFRAWEAACPNQAPSSCSKMTINGLNAKCACDSKEYSLFTGVGNGEYPMIGYRIEILGNNNLRISN